MKFRHFLSAVAMAVVAAVSCQEKAVIENPLDDQETFTVQLGFGGDLDVTYEPLTRGKDNNDLYGIQVWCAPLEEAKTSWEAYANGLFDDVSNVSVSLLKGFKYKFVATMVVDGKDKINSYYGTYNSPFWLANGGERSAIGNIFNYNLYYFLYIDSGWSYIKDNGTSTGYYRPNTDRYYGEYLDYNPEESSNDKVKIKMKRVSYGAKFMAKGKLATAGQLQIKMDDSPEIMMDLANEQKYEDIYTFYNVKAAHDHQTGNYEEEVATTINWYYQKEDGTTVTVPLGTHKFVFKRNATTVVQINLENTNIEGGLGFEIAETGAMPEGEVYDITDGENVDTEVSTNK